MSLTQTAEYMDGRTDEERKNAPKSTTTTASSNDTGGLVYFMRKSKLDGFNDFLEILRDGGSLIAPELIVKLDELYTKRKDEMEQGVRNILEEEVKYLSKGKRTKEQVIDKIMEWINR